MAKKVEFWYSNGLSRILRSGTLKETFDHDGLTFNAIQIKQEMYITYQGYYMFRRPAGYGLEAVIDIFRVSYLDNQTNKEKVEEFLKRSEALDVDS
jgi:hypothetical protein